MVELPAASGILELQAERRCDVAIDPLRLSAVDRVGQPGMATQSACMLTRTSSGTLGYLDGLFGPPWVIKGILGAFWMIGPHTGGSVGFRPHDAVIVTFRRDSDADAVTITAFRLVAAAAVTDSVDTRYGARAWPVARRSRAFQPGLARAAEAHDRAVLGAPRRKDAGGLERRAARRSEGFAGHVSVLRQGLRSGRRLARNGNEGVQGRGVQRAWLLQHMCEPSFAQRGEVPENVWPKQVPSGRGSHAGTGPLAWHAVC